MSLASFYVALAVAPRGRYGARAAVKALYITNQLNITGAPQGPATTPTPLGHSSYLQTMGHRLTNSIDSVCLPGRSHAPKNVVVTKARERRLGPNLT